MRAFHIQHPRFLTIGRNNLRRHDPCRAAARHRSHRSPNRRPAGKDSGRAAVGTPHEFTCNANESLATQREAVAELTRHNLGMLVAHPPPDRAKTVIALRWSSRPTRRKLVQWLIVRRMADMAGSSPIMISRREAGSAWRRRAEAPGIHRNRHPARRSTDRTMSPR